MRSEFSNGTWEYDYPTSGRDTRDGNRQSMNGPAGRWLGGGSQLGLSSTHQQQTRAEVGSGCFLASSSFACFSVVGSRNVFKDARLAVVLS